MQDLSSFMKPTSWTKGMSALSLGVNSNKGEKRQTRYLQTETKQGHCTGELHWKGIKLSKAEKNTNPEKKNQMGKITECLVETFAQ